jgi:hypothetical protein
VKQPLSGLTQDARKTFSSHTRSLKIQRISGVKVQLKCQGLQARKGNAIVTLDASERQACL